jgi:hypothetical protein
MNAPRERRWLAGSLVTLLSSAAPVRAAIAGELPPIEWSGPSSCFDAPTFRERLLALSPSDATTPLPQAIAIQLTRDDHHFRGKIQVTHHDGTTTMRSVDSSDCLEVADALELIAALAIGLERPPGPEKLAEPAPPASAVPLTQLESAETERKNWRFYAAIRGAVLSGAGPQVELAPQLAIGVTLDTRGWLAPSFEISGIWATSGTLRTGSGAATLTLLSGAATACPTRFALVGAFAARPCLEIAVSWLRGSSVVGVDVVSGPAEVQSWLALGPLGRIEWQPTRSIRVDADAGLSFHLTRPRFFFSPSGENVYQVPAAAIAPRLGVAFLFP